MSVYIKRTEISQINDLMLHLKLLEKIRTSKTQNKQKERNNINKGQNYWNADQKKKKTKQTYKETTKQKASSLKKNNQDWQAPGKSD
jgi:hypothetical protein